MTGFPARLAALGLTPDHFREEFTRAAGPGGQNVNKVATAVTVLHLATGHRIKALDERSQARNRALAWERMADWLEDRARALAAARRDELERERRRTRGKPRALKRAQVQEKRHRQRVRAARRAGPDS